MLKKLLICLLALNAYTAQAHGGGSNYQNTSDDSYGFYTGFIAGVGTVTVVLAGLLLLASHNEALERALLEKLITDKKFVYKDITYAVVYSHLSE